MKIIIRGEGESFAGCTANVALVYDNTILCANAGDSRAIKVAFVGTQNEQGGSLTRKSK